MIPNQSLATGDEDIVQFEAKELSVLHFAGVESKPFSPAGKNSKSK